MSGNDDVLACVVLAHSDPAQVQRLIRALAPFPVFLHCDRRTSPSDFEAMTANLPVHCTVLDRMATGWARWENVAAELQGYRVALAATQASHIALLTGTDYPLAPADRIADFLRRHNGISFARYHKLPYPGWGRSGGFDRLRYRHWPYRKRMLRMPIPRRLPAGITFAGGSQLKVLARHHARAVLDAAAARPELEKFWRRSWVADETYVASILNTTSYAPDWEHAHISESLWWIGWDGTRRKSPPWLDLDALPALELGRESPDRPPRLFARKFSSEHPQILDAIDVTFRSASG